MRWPGSAARTRDAVRVGARRAAGDLVRVTATPGEDVVLLHIANGPALVLHPATARDLMLGQSTQKRTTRSSAGVEVEAPLPGEVQVPAQLQWRGLEQAAATTRGVTRGFLGDVVLSAVEVITGIDLDPVADFAASRAVARIDGAVDAGVYPLQPQGLRSLKGSPRPERLPEAPPGEPTLVLIHGTFSDTPGTFGKLWTLHSQRVRELFDHYDGRVFALDHPTLGVSPIANALTLARALPDGASLHLLTHSRGGLVAEVLACVCGARAADALDLSAFEADPAYAEQRGELAELIALVRERRITVDRIVRVACPARGTLLASGRLDAYLSVLKWGLELAGLPVVPALIDFLGQVAKRREDPRQLPGLAAMMPGSPLVEWLNTAEEPVPGELRVIAGDLQGDSVGSWLKTLLADAFYWTDNDIVVQTRSMYGGTPREAGASFLLDRGGKVTHFSYFGNERTVQAIVGALTQERPQGFRSIGPL